MPVPIVPVRRVPFDWYSETWLLAAPGSISKAFSLPLALTTSTAPTSLLASVPEKVIFRRVVGLPLPTVALAPLIVESPRSAS